MKRQSRSYSAAAIVVAWNSKDRIGPCLKSLGGLDSPDARIVVVDNASTDGTAAYVRREWPHVHLLCNETNTGFTGGVNTALRWALEAGVEYFWLVNDDIDFPRDCLSALIEGARRRAVDMASPVILFGNDRTRVQFAGQFVDWRNQRTQVTVDVDEAESWQGRADIESVLWGTALLITRKLVEKVGLLDERFFAYYEDVDLGVRTRRAGLRCATIGETRVWHHNPLVLRSRKPYFHYLMTRNESIFFLKYLTGRARVAFRRRHLARSLRVAGSCMDAGMVDNATSVLSGLWDASSGTGGPVRNHNIPRWLSRAMLAHPYFVSDLIEGKFSALARSALRKVRG